MDRLERILKRSDAETNHRVLIIKQIENKKYISVNKTCKNINVKKKHRIFE